MKNLGKNIFDELFGPYSKKPPGPVGEGVQVPGSGGYLGEYARYVNEKAPGQEWNFPYQGRVQSSASTGRTTPPVRRPASLASRLRLCQKGDGV